MNHLPPDPYRILSIAPDAQLPEIRAAHRKLVKVCHPDKVSAEASDEERRTKEDEFKRVQEAYELLSDDIARTKYDESMKIYNKWKATQKVAQAAAAFSSPLRRAETWQAGMPPPNVRTAEPRPDTFSSKSPPRDAPESYHRASRDFEQARPERTDRPRPNMKAERSDRPEREREHHRARRTPSYETHPDHASPNEEMKAALEKERLENKKLAAELEKSQKTAEKNAEKLRKGRRDSKAKEKEKAARKEEKTRKSKESPYVEEPNAGANRSSEEVTSNRTVKPKTSSSKPLHKSAHRLSSRSRSRSRRRPEKPTRKEPTRKQSRENSHIQEPEVEEADEDDLPRKMADVNSYLGRSSRGHGVSSGVGPQDYIPNAPTPPPQAHKRPPPSGPPPMHPINLDAGSPRLPSDPNSHVPRPFRSNTAPIPSYNTRPTAVPPISETQDPSGYYGSPTASRGRQRSKLAQKYYVDEDEEMQGSTSRSRRGSSNTFAGQPGYSVPPGRYTTGGSQDQYYNYNSGHSPKQQHYMPMGSMPMGSIPVHGVPPQSGARHVPPSGQPFANNVKTVPVYILDDVIYTDDFSV